MQTLHPLGTILDTVCVKQNIHNLIALKEWGGNKI